MPRHHFALFLLLLMTPLSIVLASDGKGEQRVPTDPVYLSTPLPLAKLHRAAASRHVLARIDAVRELAARGDRRSGPVMRERLADPEPLVRRFAALGLGHAADPGDAPALAHTLLDPEAAVRHAAGSSLLKLPAAAVAEAVLAELRRADCRLRPAASSADARMAMRDWGQSQLVVAKKVLQSLATRDTGTLKRLKRALHSRKRCVRYAAAYALARSPRPGASKALERAAARGDVAVIAGAWPRYLASDRPGQRRALIAGALRFDDPDLILGLRASGDPELQAMAARVLAIKGIDIQEVMTP